jgi:hypothetical protein
MSFDFAFVRLFNPGGSLDLIRRCDSMSCEGHCVCAPQDQKCQFSPSLGACNDLTACKYLLLEISSISSMSVHSADVVKHVNENWRT